MVALVTPLTFVHAQPIETYADLHFDVNFNNSNKYLGLYLVPKLSFNNHINTALQKATIASTQLASLVVRWNTLPIRHKLLLYKDIVRPVLMYGSQVWGSTSQMNIKKLQVFQNKQLMHFVMSDGISDVKSFMTTSKLIQFRSL
ncbi:hypothetical protein AVEN_162154-1 [Araneus ventricosus]|uniref:RNA-directed DNA polymerase from mobile element jockey n=1 Tax=Araneus ventricosus TaxID=182803 RepID=A0A4Y2SIM7_ARAVE|nr:hypothetical protein AVEN_162154-1 [Araneus ventricosus]